MALTLLSEVKRNGALLHAAVHDETLMMNMDSGTYYSVNEVGSRIWELLAEPMVLTELCARIVEEFDVEPKTCEAEVLAFVADLVDRGIVNVTRG
jgi:hypothetical protein